MEKMNITANTNRFIKEVIEGNEYSLLFKDLVILDVGCNIGTFSLWIHQLARKVYAVDISQENIDNFNKTINDNFVGNIETFHCGIAGKNGLRGIEARGSAGMGGWALSSGSGDLRTYSLKSFMDMNKIDYIDVLKIDVEGAEEEILLAPDVPYEKISIIIGEVHHPHLASNIKPHLERKGYRYYDRGGLFLARKI